ncbi:unnamed protein product, partial [Didymodactylos carnosus]
FSRKKRKNVGDFEFYYIGLVIKTIRSSTLTTIDELGAFHECLLPHVKKCFSKALFNKTKATSGEQHSESSGYSSMDLNTSIFDLDELSTNLSQKSSIRVITVKRSNRMSNDVNERRENALVNLPNMPTKVVEPLKIKRSPTSPVTVIKIPQKVSNVCLINSDEKDKQNGTSIASQSTMAIDLSESNFKPQMSAVSVVRLKRIPSSPQSIESNHCRSSIHKAIKVEPLPDKLACLKTTEEQFNVIKLPRSTTSVKAERIVPKSSEPERTKSLETINQRQSANNREYNGILKQRFHHMSLVNVTKVKRIQSTSPNELNIDSIPNDESKTKLRYNAFSGRRKSFTTSVGSATKEAEKLVRERRKSVTVIKLPRIHS